MYTICMSSYNVYNMRVITQIIYTCKLCFLLNSFAFVVYVYSVIYWLRSLYNYVTVVQDANKALLFASDGGHAAVVKVLVDYYCNKTTGLDINYCDEVKESERRIRIHIKLQNMAINILLISCFYSYCLLSPESQRICLQVQGTT